MAGYAGIRDRPQASFGGTLTCARDRRQHDSGYDRWDADAVFHILKFVFKSARGISYPTPNNF
jgi:hypothetical protein